MLTLVGGKLTTWRRSANSLPMRCCIGSNCKGWRRQSPGPVPEGRAFPASTANSASMFAELAAQFHRDASQIRAMWALCGSRVRAFSNRMVETCPVRKRRARLAVAFCPERSLPGSSKTNGPSGSKICRAVRLMLIFEPGLSRQTIGDLADLLIDAGKLEAAARESAIETAVRRCREIYGRTLTA